MVRLDGCDALALRLIAEDAAGVPDAQRWANIGAYTLDTSDNAPCMTLVLPKGGARE